MASTIQQSLSGLKLKRAMNKNLHNYAPKLYRLSHSKWRIKHKLPSDSRAKVTTVHSSGINSDTGHVWLVPDYSKLMHM